jgi:general secretion pathway protein E
VSADLEPLTLAEDPPAPTPATAEAGVAAATPIPAAPQLTFAFCKRHGVMIQRVVDGVAEAVYRVGAQPSSIAEVRRVLGLPLQLRRVDSEQFDELLRKLYEGGTNTAMQMAGNFEDDTDLAHLAQDLPEPSDLLESDDHAPIIKLINAILTQAVKDNASDIHIEPFENRLVVRFRVDGVLREALQYHASRSCPSWTSPRNACPRTAAFHCASPAARWTCVSPPSRRVMANASCCVCSTSRRAGWN